MSDKSDDTAFNKFWESYPKKEKKQETRKVWVKKKLDPLLEVILSFITLARATDRWKKGFVKQPPAFLNGECWEDDLSSYNDKNATHRPDNVLAAKEGKYAKYS